MRGSALSPKPRLVGHTIRHWEGAEDILQFATFWQKQYIKCRQLYPPTLTGVVFWPSYVSGCSQHCQHHPLAALGSVSYPLIAYYLGSCCSLQNGLWHTPIHLPRLLVKFSVPPSIHLWSPRRINYSFIYVFRAHNKCFYDHFLH